MRDRITIMNRKLFISSTLLVFALPLASLAFTFTRTPDGSSPTNPIHFESQQSFVEDIVGCQDSRHQLVIFEGNSTNYGNAGYYFPIRSSSTANGFLTDETGNLNIGTTYTSVASFTFQPTDTTVPNCDINILEYSSFTVQATGGGGGTVPPPPPPTTSTKFIIGDRVQVNAGPLNVRSSPSLSAEILGTQNLGALGTVIGGSLYSDGSWWWQIDYDFGADGWSIEDYLNKVTATPPPPPAPPPSAFTKFVVGDRIETLYNVKVRSLPSLSGTVLGGQKQGSQGTVVGGPIFADGYWWWQVNYDSGADGWSAEDFLKKVSATGLPPPGSVSTKFIIGDRVEVTDILKVRAAPSLSGARLGNQKKGNRGVVIGGPIFADGYWWWQINYDSGADGWSAEDFLIKITAPIQQQTAF